MIKWGRAGRPRKNPVVQVVTEEEESSKPWTRAELRISTNAVQALAAAVIKQWVDDGKPRCDEISLWVKLVQYEEKRKDDKAVYHVGDANGQEMDA